MLQLLVGLGQRLKPRFQLLNLGWFAHGKSPVKNVFPTGGSWVMVLNF
jgi:hypothetical protein